MSPRATLWMCAGCAAAIGSLFALLVRLPLPFDGFAVLAAASIAFLGTLALAAALPSKWLWTEIELLNHAFQKRHSLSDSAAGMALDAICTAHNRATALRKSSTIMRGDVKQKIGDAADRLDEAAREIFYEPKRLKSLRAILIRSELIEDAATAHSILRKKEQRQTEAQSRKKLLEAVDALNAAFDASDLSVARGLLMDVEVASSVAENVLRRPLTHNS